MAVRRVVPDFESWDPAASAEFYANLAGLEVVMDEGWSSRSPPARKPTAQISVLRQDATAPVPPDVSIEVDDVDAAHSAAQRQGSEIVYR